MNNLSVGDFSIGSSGGTLTIKGADSSVSLSPAEASKLIDLIDLALQASNLPAVPPKLAYTPFRVSFTEDGGMELSRIDAKGSVKFTAKTGDDLIATINIGLKRHTDELRIAGGARRGVSSFNPKDPPLDGR